MESNKPPKPLEMTPIATSILKIKPPFLDNILPYNLKNIKLEIIPH
jgi:hypothetical protein